MWRLAGRDEVGMLVFHRVLVEDWVEEVRIPEADFWGRS